ncbi:protein COBRA [Cannabis sativa]|uniref:protein COBRA n=1 Tax=Cannabis sativa TaxID=3483 RepID=UPI0029CA218D|nr:protein COBRA [Cannabis sativa]
MIVKMYWNRAIFLHCLFSLAISSLSFHQINGYDWRDPLGNITIRWDIISPTPDGYVAVVNITNYQKYRKVDAPGWKLSWRWAHKEIIWTTIGARVADQGNCRRFKKNVPTSCAKAPTIFDLTANDDEVKQNQKIDGCCKGGVLLSRVQSYHNSTTAFQIAVGGEGSSNITWRLPTNYTFRTPHGAYSCSRARVVPNTRFISADRRRITQAMKTWKVECSYKPPSQFKDVPNQCCVSLSSALGVNTSCPICSCSCPNQNHSCSTKRHDRLVSKIECTKHMCPVNINWQVINHQRKVRVTISNLNYAKNYQDWIMLAEHPAFDNSTTLLHANHKFLSPKSYSNKMEVVWGRRGYNDALTPFGKKGSSIKMVMVFKRYKAGHHDRVATADWKNPPDAIFFNGDLCVIPNTTQF